MATSVLGLAAVLVATPLDLSITIFDGVTAAAVHGKQGTYGNKITRDFMADVLLYNSWHSHRPPSTGPRS